jgi:glutathione S-transferase
MSTPVLWHLKVSHYNEKARWALDYKNVPHVRRAAVAGRHQKIAKELTGGSTLPVLVLDGEAIGDSTRIIETLERRFPEPPLYPADPDERRRALELEDFFDEELGAYVRLLVIHHMLPAGDLFLGAFLPDLRGIRRMTARAAFPRLRPRIAATFEIDDGSVARAYGKLAAAAERFKAELQPNGHLVGDTFTVADLTLAALLAPAVAPEQFPYPQPQREHPLLAPLREALAEPGLLDWTRETYRRWRSPSAEISEESAEPARPASISA